MTTPPPSPPDVPASPTPATPAAAAQSTQQATNSAATQQTASVRALATALNVPAPVYAFVSKATVTAYAAPTISVQLSGDTTTTVTGVVALDSYSPVVGDTCLVVKQGSELFALGQLNDTNQGNSSNGWQTPTLGSGFTTNGNSNGNIQFRPVIDNGDSCVQFKGSVALSGTPTAVFTLPAGSRPSTKRTVLLARSESQGVTSVQVDINTDGTVVVDAAASITSDSTTPGSGGGPNVSSTLGASGGGTGGSSSGGTGGPSGGSDGPSGGSDGNSSFFTDWDTNPAGATATHFHGIDKGSANNSHTHGLGGHTHGLGGHSHSDFHTHSEGSHSHDMNGHTHTGSSHAHTVTPGAPTWISFNGLSIFLN